MTKPVLPPGSSSARAPATSSPYKKVDRRKLGELMSPWGGDFSYGRGAGTVGAVSSFYSSGKTYPDKKIVDEAFSETERLRSLARHGAHGWGPKDVKTLDRISKGLLYYLNHDYED
jgi:hypothetical protein